MQSEARMGWLDFWLDVPLPHLLNTRTHTVSALKLHYITVLHTAAIKPL